MKKQKLIITFHGEYLALPWTITGDFRIRQRFKLWIKLLEKIYVMALRRATYIIADNAQLRDAAIAVGVRADKVKIVSAFIPFLKKPSDYEKIPSEIWSYISAHYPLLCSICSIDKYQNEDLYGVDLLLDGLEILKREYPGIGLLLILLDVRRPDYWKELLARIEDKNLGKNLLIIEERFPEIYPILERCSVFLRATNSDGDSISVREALYLNIPVIASDAVPRPPGTILFKNRNLDSLIQALETTLWKARHRLLAEKISVTEDGFQQLDRIYRGLLQVAPISGARSSTSQESAREHFWADAAPNPKAIDIDRYYHSYPGLGMLRALGELMPSSLEDKKLLDVGCGVGYYFKYFRRKRASRLFGADTGLRLLNTAQTINPFIRVVRARGEKLPFPDEYFDIVISLGLVEHFPQPSLILNELARVLKTGGTLIVETPNLLNPIFTLYKIINRKKLVWEYWWHPRDLIRQVGSIPALRVKKFNSAFICPWFTRRWIDNRLTRRFNLPRRISAWEGNRCLKYFGSLMFVAAEKVFRPRED